MQHFKKYYLSIAPFFSNNGGNSSFFGIIGGLFWGFLRSNLLDNSFYDCSVLWSVVGCSVLVSIWQLLYTTEQKVKTQNTKGLKFSLRIFVVLFFWSLFLFRFVFFFATQLGNFLAVLWFFQIFGFFWLRLRRRTDSFFGRFYLKEEDLQDKG